MSKPSSMKLNSVPSVCEEALGAVSLHDDFSEPYIHYPSLSNESGTYSSFDTSCPLILKKNSLYPSLHEDTPPDLSTSWVQIPNEVKEAKPSSKLNDSFTIISHNEDSITEFELNNSPRKETNIINQVNSARKIKLPKVKLGKYLRSNSEPQQFFVKSGCGMGVSVPDLCLDSEYFGEPSTKVSNSKFYKIDLDSDSLSAMQQSSKNTMESSKTSNKKKLQPSETLALSAAAMKSYFWPTSASKSVEEEKSESDESMKSKVLDLWHNVKYSGWAINSKTNFSRDIPINMFGKVYHHTFTINSYKCGDIEKFKEDFYTLMWFTYRRKFPPLPYSMLTSDCGWGCMIRCGQMMMSQALCRHFLPPGYNWLPHDVNSLSLTRIHNKILNWFSDSQSQQSPFSIHNLVEAGHSMHKQAGNWYGPTTVVHMMKDVLANASMTSYFNDICIYVAQDGGLYIQDILDMCSSEKCCCKKDPEDMDLSDWVFSEIPVSKYSNVSKKESFKQNRLLNNNKQSIEDLVSNNSSRHNNGFEKSSFQSNRSSTSNHSEGEWDLLSFPINTENDKTCKCNGWKSVILLVPVRMGSGEVNTIYNECIYALLMDELCIGILGGKPKHALYFVGFQHDELIHLDPHISQDAVPQTSTEDFATYHCMSPRKLAISKLDPSATFGFYCKTQADFYALVERIPKLATAKDGSIDSPMFEFLDGRCPTISSPIKTSGRTSFSRSNMSSTDADEFVIE